MKLPNATPRLTYLVVLCAMAAILVVLAYHLTGKHWGTLLTLVLLYEGWTLETGKGATISEAFWALSARPLVPFAGGLACGWALFSHRVEDPFLILVMGVMAGHFWFQRQQ
jgi:hypothetical protein